MKRLAFTFIVVLFFTSSSFSQQYNPLNFVGIWKIEGKETFESWTITNDNNLEGLSYKLINNENSILENLKIIKSDSSIIYKAQVLNQNDKKWVSFYLNYKETGKLSFENSEHYFPKKIQYTFIDKSKIYVEVKGKKDQGFSYYLLRIE